MRFFNIHAATAVIFANEKYLSNPYRDYTQPTHPYIDIHGNEQSYPKDRVLKKIQGEVYKPNHGLAHTLRVVRNVRDMVDWYSNENIHLDAQSRQYFAHFNTPEEIEKLEIVATFYVVGRDSEVSFRDNPEAYSRYRRASSKAFYDYAKTLMEPRFSQEELEYYAEILRDTYFDPKIDPPNLVSKDKDLAKKTAAKAILFSAHCFDLPRCYLPSKMNPTIENVLAPLCASKNKNVSRMHMVKCFLRSEIRLILMGNNRNSSITEDGKEFAYLNFQTRKLALFRMANTNAAIAIRLIELSEHIEDTISAQKWAALLNAYASKGEAALADFLTEIENSSLPLASLLLREQKKLKNSEGGQIFKVVSHGEKHKEKLWNHIVESLADTEKYRPEIIPGYGALRPEERKKYTARLNASSYEVVERKTRSLFGEKKLKHTKHQSTSYFNPKIGYMPRYYKQESANPDSLDVGVYFGLEDCILHSIAIRYYSSFQDRELDFDDKQHGHTVIKKRVHDGLLYTSVNRLQAWAIQNYPDDLNELLAGFRWTERSGVLIFSNNLESRLLALVRASHLQIRFKDTHPGLPTIPIKFYPLFSDYTPEQQKQDLETANYHPFLRKYVTALHLMVNPQEAIKSLPLMDIFNGIKLLKYVSPKIADTLKALFCDHVNLRNQLFLNLKWSDIGLKTKQVLEKKFPHILQNTTTPDSLQESSISLYTDISLITEIMQSLSDGKTIEESVDSLEKLRCCLIYEGDCGWPKLDIRKHAETLIKTKEDIRSGLSNNLIYLYCGKIFLEKIDSLSFLQKLVTTVEMSVLLLAKADLIPDISTLMLIINSIETEPDGKKGVVQYVFPAFADRINSINDFLEMVDYLSEKNKIQIRSKCIGKIADWINEGGCTTEEVAAVFKHFIRPEREVILEKIDRDWILSHLDTPESFCDLAPYLGLRELSIILDNETLSQKRILEFFSQLKTGIKCWCENPRILSLLIKHPKTKTLIERSWLGSGDFIDAVANSNENSIRAVLAAPYYNTPEGRRALRSAQLRVSPGKNISRVDLSDMIEQKLPRSEGKFASTQSQFLATEFLNASEIYRATVGLCSDAIKNKFADPLKTTKQYWTHVVYNDQQEEVGRMVYPHSALGVDVPHIIYYPGVLEKGKPGIPLSEIKAFVDMKIKEAIPDLNWRSVIRHFTLINGDNYLVGVSQHGHLDIESASRLDKVRLCGRFQNTVDCGTNSHSYCADDSDNAGYAAVLSHACVLGDLTCNRVQFVDGKKIRKEIVTHKRNIYYEPIAVSYPAPNAITVNSSSVVCAGLFRVGSGLPSQPLVTETSKQPRKK